MSGQLPPVGTIVNGTYRLDALLGEGGAGAVFRATHLGLQKAFALKVLLSPPGATTRFFERFRVEAETLGRLDAPGIVRVTDFGVDGRGEGLPYLVMELLEGATLEGRCAAGPMALDRAVPILADVAAALDAAHGAGVVHGDLTARNVMMTSGGRAVVIDFGLARILSAEGDDAPEGPAHLMGTVAYMAPEMSTGAPPSPSSDVYAFGVLAYRLLTGWYPFEGSRAAILEAHGVATPASPSSLTPGLPPAVDDVLADALAKPPARRPQSTGEISRALSRIERQAARAAWWRRELPRRAAAALLIALAAASSGPFLESLGLVRRLEGVAFDSRVRWSSPRQPDPRLLLVSFDDRSLAADATPLPDRADEVGRRLNALMAAGVDFVGVDLLLPAHWGESRGFAELVLRHAPRLALALAQEGETLVGLESVGGLISSALGRDAATALFASVNVEPDLDGVVRSARLFRVTGDGVLQPTLAAKVAGWPDRRGIEDPNGSFPIDYRLDPRSVERISWVDLDARLREDFPAFEGRLVLVGAELAGSGDRHLAPRAASAPADITGLEQQAIVAATVLSPDRLSQPGGWGRGLALALHVLAMASVGLIALLKFGTLSLLAALATAGAAWTGGSMASFAAGVLVPVAVPLAHMFMAAAVAWAWSRGWSNPPAPARTLPAPGREQPGAGNSQHWP
jgi:CHASE2 domain-containing sensor protein